MRGIGSAGEVHAAPTRRALEWVVLQHQTHEHRQPRPRLPQRFDEIEHRAPLLGAVLRAQSGHAQGMQAVFNGLEYFIDPSTGRSIGVFAFGKPMTQCLCKGFLWQGGAHLRIPRQSLQTTDHKVHRHLHLQVFHRFVHQPAQARGGVFQRICRAQQGLY